jgi:hypothetical protein
MVTVGGEDATFRPVLAQKMFGYNEIPVWRRSVGTNSRDERIRWTMLCYSNFVVTFATFSPSLLLSLTHSLTHSFTSCTPSPALSLSIRQFTQYFSLS